MKNSLEYNRELLSTVKPEMSYKGENYEQWKNESRKKLSSLLGMDKFLLADLDFKVEYEKEIENATEIRFTYQSEKGYRVPAHLLLPKGKEKPPLMICLQDHSTGMHISLGRPKYPGDEELINGGDRDFCIRALKEYVLALCDAWNLDEKFKKWVNDSNVFCSTLVDRIVTGYPKGYADKICKELGYEDKLVDIGEPFALWVIESDKDISGELPLDKIGLPVIFTDNHKPYKERKVRVLNGAHTSSVLAGYLYGIDIVRDCMSDELMGDFIRRVVMDEIVPQVNLPIDEVKAFADSVFERFENPFIDHALLSISLNSVSKWRARVLPSFKDYCKNIGKLPKLITFSFSSLLAFYSSNNLRDDGLYAKRGNGDEYVIHDDKFVLDFFAENTGKIDFIEKVCKNTDFWGENLTHYADFQKEVSYWYDKIIDNPKKALEEVLA